MRRILIVEDNPEMNEMITTILKKEYEITNAYSGTEGLLYFQMQPFDLVLLDRMLPGKTGEEVLLEIRKTSHIPVIMLTALREKAEIADLLVKGANDYITKPFDINELKARILVQLRENETSNNEEQATELTYKNISLFPESYEIGNLQKRTPLKKKEFDILTLLVKHPHKVFTKEAIYNQVWRETYYGDENTINVHVSSLRKKIKELDPENEYIETVWGIGIKLAANPTYPVTH